MRLGPMDGEMFRALMLTRQGDMLIHGVRQRRAFFYQECSRAMMCSRNANKAEPKPGGSMTGFGQD